MDVSAEVLDSPDLMPDGAAEAPNASATAGVPNAVNSKSCRVLKMILSPSQQAEMDLDTINKIEEYFYHKFTDFMAATAKFSTAERQIDELKRQCERADAHREDFEAKYAFAKQNADELRDQLNASRADVRGATAQVERADAEIAKYRQERNAVVDERDQLQSIANRLQMTVARLQADCHQLQMQLEAAIVAKNDALVRIDEIETREHAVEQRERHIEQDRDLLQSQIAALTESLHKSMKENQLIRQENTLARMNMETDLAHKTEQLKQSLIECAQFAETNQALTVQAEELTLKLKDQSQESAKMMDHYHKELQAKQELVALYKASVDDDRAEKSELTLAIDALRRHLDEVTVRYGELETRLRDVGAEHALELARRDEQLDALRDELQNANDLLSATQAEQLDQVLEQMTPAAAAASRRLKSGMSLSEIFTEYVKVAQELQLKERECSHNEIQLKSIVAELEEKAPVWKRQSIEHRETLAANEELQTQLANLIAEQVKMREQTKLADGKRAAAEREVAKLTTMKIDLSRQTCYLLKEIEQMRGGYVSQHDGQTLAGDTSANDLISAKLVTFANIAELQDNNQKLLLLVRDLGGKLDELEVVQSRFNQQSFETELSRANQRIAELETAAEAQQKTLASTGELMERFKRLYYEIMRDVGQGVARGENGMDVNQNGTGGRSDEALALKDTKIGDLEERLADQQRQLKTLREEYADYRKEKQANDKLTNQQLDHLRVEVREVTSHNCTLSAKVAFHIDQMAVQTKNIDVYKTQIKTLEDRNRNYDKTIGKHEHTMALLRDAAMNEQQRCSMAEIQSQKLGQQLRQLQEDVCRVTAERDALYRERQNQNMLQNNLELIKTTFERSENEGRLRMEQRFDEAQRECSALRLRLQEEQDHFRELSADLKRQTESAQLKQRDEQIECERQRGQVDALRAELEAKSRHIEELSAKLQESLSPLDADNPVARANRELREMRTQHDQLVAERELLRRDLKSAQNYLDVQIKTASDWEQVNNRLNAEYEQHKTSSAQRLAELTESERSLRAQLEQKDAELHLQITGAQINCSDTSSALHGAQQQLQDALRRASTASRELGELRSECQQLKQSLSAVEHKYSNEMIAHSGDIKELTACKEQLDSIREQIETLRHERTVAVETLKAQESEHQRLVADRDAERRDTETRIADLNAQNTLLHDQLQALNANMSESLNSSSAQLNDSALASDEPNAHLNRSDDGSSRPADHLPTIIKYLRREKDLANKKVDILRAENVRLTTEASILQKRIADANELADERQKANANIISSVKHSELLRKVETLNAMTDSNRLLRDERDALTKRTRELNERISKLEDELFPLQEQNRDLLAKNEEQAGENQTLRRNAEQWQKRATSLVERANKNPEDFKRLQAEREHLAKLLTAEKETSRTLSAEAMAVKTEKLRLETDANVLRSQSGVLAEERRKLTDELAALRLSGDETRLERDLLRDTGKQNEDKIREYVEKITTIETQMLELRSKELRVRSLAKKFKEGYLDMKKRHDQLAAEKTRAMAAGKWPDSDDAAAAAAASAPADGAASDASDIGAVDLATSGDSQRVAELLGQLGALRAELDAKAGGDAGNAQLLTEQAARIKLLTEAHAQVSRELQALKAIHDMCEQSRCENELKIAAQKSQLDARIGRLEKELADQEQAAKEASARLQRDNETLTLRVNQLHRQLQAQGSKASPSTSAGEKSSSDAARTANVKPMAGPSGGQQSAAVTPRRGGDTPLASIRPMSVQTNSSRTAAVLPTSQNIVAAVQGSSVAAAAAASTASSSSTASTSTTSSAAVAGVAPVAGGSSAAVIPLIPPQQQVHTTGTLSSAASSASSSSASAEAMCSSPTSSHTEYMPASSSAVVVAAVPPMGSGSSSSSSSAESSQEAESMPNISAAALGESIALVQQSLAIAGPSGSSALLVQQAVALVSPRVEVQPSGGLPQALAVAQPQAAAVQHQLAAASSGAPNVSGSSTSSTSSSFAFSGSSTVGGSQQPQPQPQQLQHHQLQQLQQASSSSSSSVTTTHKRPREADAGGDSPAPSAPFASAQPGGSAPDQQLSPQSKRSRMSSAAMMEPAASFQGVSESGVDVEYQVPTSSQRDQEDDSVIVVDSDEDRDDDDEEEEEMADDGIAEPFDEDNEYDGMEEEAYHHHHHRHHHRQANEADDGNDGGAMAAAIVGADGRADGDASAVGGNEVYVEDSRDAPVAHGSGSSNSSGSAVLVIDDVGTSDELDAGAAAAVAAAEAAEAASSLVLLQADDNSMMAMADDDQPACAAHQQFQAISSASSQPPLSLQQQQQFDGDSDSVDGHLFRAGGDQASLDGAELDQNSVDAAILDDGPDQRMADEEEGANEAAVVVGGSSRSSPLVGNAVDDDDDEDEDDDDDDVALELAAVRARAETGEPVASGSGVALGAPQAMLGQVQPVQGNEHANNGASTSGDVVIDAAFDNSNHPNARADDDIGTDGVTSEGEKVPTEDIHQLEEGREAEATIQTPSSNTRSRTPRMRGGRGGAAATAVAARGRATPASERNPIVWDGATSPNNSVPGGAAVAGRGSPASANNTPTRGRNVRRSRR